MGFKSVPKIPKIQYCTFALNENPKVAANLLHTSKFPDILAFLGLAQSNLLAVSVW
jgi:hypothetical protein